MIPKLTFTRFWLLSLLSIALFFGSTATYAQTPIDVGNQVGTFTSMVRGYYFTAPTNFTICQLYIPDDASTGVQNIEVVRFNAGAPPAFAGTTNAFTSLFYINNYAPNTPIPCNIQVNAGDIIGVYGARGTNMVNSYGPTQHVTNILGTNVTLYRSGMQANLNTQQMANIWSENNYNIGRVMMYINCCTPPNAFPAPIQGDSLVCLNDVEAYSVDTNGVGFGPTAYNWTVPTGTQILSGQGTNTIQVQHGGSINGSICVTATNLCDSVSQCFNVYKDTLDQPTLITGPDTVCAGASYNFSIPTDPEATGYVWQLPVGAQITAGQLTNNVTIEFGQTVVNPTVCGASFNGCDTSLFKCKTIYIDSIPVVSPPMAGLNPICEGGNTTVSISAVSNATSYTWSVNNGSSITAGQGSTTIDIDLPNIGNTVICVEAANQCGVSLPFCDTISVDELIVANAGTDTAFCQNDGFVNANTAIPGAGLWTQTAGIGSVTFGDPTLPSTSADVTILGTYEFTWTITNGACVSADTVEVSYDQEPISLAGSDQDVCGLTHSMSATNPNIGTGHWTQWNGPGGSTFADSTQAQSSVTVDTYGTYQYLWVATNGACTAVDTVEIAYFEQPAPVYVGEDTVVCVPFFTLYADSPTVGTGIWNNLTPSLPAQFNPLEDTTFVTQVDQATYLFEWVVTNGPCPASTDEIEVRVADPNSVQAAFDYDPKDINAFDPVQFYDLSSGATMWDWFFGDGATSLEQNPVYAYPAGAQYTVYLTVSNNDGCFDTDSLTFEVFSDIIVPNIITPNGDNMNDVLKLQAGGLSSFTLQIFNRFGRIVFETNDVNDFWNGTNENNEVVDGVYFYAITAETRGQGVKKYSGNITVIR